MCSCSFNKHLGTFYTTNMCTYQGRIPNEDQILCKNMMVYLKIYKWYNAALNKHHKKMSSTIKFNPIILCMCVSRQTRFWLILLNVIVIPGCPYSRRYIRYICSSNHNVAYVLRMGPSILPCYNQCIYTKNYWFEGPCQTKGHKIFYLLILWVNKKVYLMYIHINSKTYYTLANLFSRFKS